MGSLHLPGIKSTNPSVSVSSLLLQRFTAGVCLSDLSSHWSTGSHPLSPFQRFCTFSYSVYFASPMDHSFQCAKNKSLKIPYLPSYVISLLTSTVKSFLKMYTSNQLLVLLQTLNLALLPRIHINNSCRITNNLLAAKSKEYDCAAIIFLSQFFPFEYMAPLTIHSLKPDVSASIILNHLA